MNSKPDPWHLLQSDDRTVCGRSTDRVHAATRYDARGLQYAISLIRNVGGIECPLCVHKARVLE